MAGRKNFPNRVKARRERALYNLKHPREDYPEDMSQETRERKIANRKEQIEILEKRI